MVYDSIGSKIDIDFDHYILVAVNRYAGMYCALWSGIGYVQFLEETIFSS